MAQPDLHKKDSLYKTVRILSIKEEVKDFKTFLLDGDIMYEAGQYLTLVKESKEGEIRRSYSFTSAPALGEPMSIGIKRIENGFFSRQLIDATQPGYELTTTGAGGRFTLPKERAHIKQVFFLAAGSGITPIYSLLKTLLHLHPEVKATLIYSNASPQKTLFLTGLETLQQQYVQQLHIEFLFSNSQNLSRARLYRDLLEQFVETYVTVPYSQALFCVCGPESYMRLCSYVLQEAGVPIDHLKKENFTIQRLKPPTNIAPDIEAHQVNLQLRGEPYRFIAQYPDTILAAAKKKGIQMPYSCEIGRCGNCVAHCTHGNIFHTYNEVLTEGELLKGLILTCTAYAIDGYVDLVID